MEIKEKMQDAISKQINRELYSGYLYLSMSTYFEEKNLRGFAKWMRIQAKEEQKHAMKMYEFMYERAGHVKLAAIEAPPHHWKSPLDVFKESYKHEQKVTEMIHNLITMAMAEKDYATMNFLQWYVEEQVEEEASPLAILQKLELIGDSANGLLMLDAEVAKRELIN